MLGLGLFKINLRVVFSARDSTHAGSYPNPFPNPARQRYIYLTKPDINKYQFYYFQLSLQATFYPEVYQTHCIFNTYHYNILFIFTLSFYQAHQLYKSNHSDPTFIFLEQNPFNLCIDIENLIVAGGSSGHMDQQR